MDVEERVKADLVAIREHMPQTYAAIKAKATEIGNEAYALVRRGLRGEPGCFYAIEAGHVKGAPGFGPVQADAASLIAQFGTTFAIFWPAPVKEDHGTH